MTAMPTMRGLAAGIVATMVTTLTLASGGQVDARVETGSLTVIPETTGFTARDARVAYNSQSDEYMVVHVDGPEVLVTRLDAQGTVLDGPTSIATSSVGTSRILPDIAYDPTSDRFLVVYATRIPASGSVIQGIRLTSAGVVDGASQMHGSLGDSVFCVAWDPEVVAGADGGFAVKYLHYYTSSTPGANCRGLSPGTSFPVIQTVGDDLSLGPDVVVPIVNNGSDAAHLGVNPTNGDLMVVGYADPESRGTFRIYDSDLAPIGAGDIERVPDVRGFFSGYYPAGDPVTGNWMITSTTTVGGHTYTDLVSPTGQALRPQQEAGNGVGAPYSIEAVGDGTFVVTTVTGKVVHVGADGSQLDLVVAMRNSALRAPVVATTSQPIDPAGMIVGEDPAAGAYATLPISIIAPGALPLVPARLLETRRGAEFTTIDGVAEGIGTRPAGDVYVLEVAGRGGVPSDAGAVLLNIAAAQAAATGYVTAFPCDADQPTTSNLNFATGAAASAAAFAKLSDEGTVCLFSSVAIELIVDVNGYVPATASVTSILPARLLETRPGQASGTTDGTFNGEGRLTAGSTTELVVAGRGGVSPTADAALLNITAVRPGAQNFITAYPCGADVPTAASVNAAAGSFVNNLVLAKIGTDGKVCLLSSSDTDLIVDVSAFVPAGGGLASVTPGRVFESRPGQETVDGEQQTGVVVAAGSETIVEITDRAGVPDGATGAMLNVAAIKPSTGGFMTVYPCDADRPNAANLNFGAGAIVSNAVFVKIDSLGQVCVYSTAASDLTVDVVGYTLDP